MIKVAFWVYLLALLSLSIWSYSQVDVKFVPFTWTPLKNFVELMKDLGNNNRLRSDSIISVSLLILFICYFLFLKHSRLIGNRKLLFLLVITIIISFFSYPAAFSHDVFSYLFDAKILTFYHQLPWLSPPSDFPSDPLLPMDYWPTSSSRYGPVWIGVSSLFYLLSRNDVVSGMYLFRLMFIIVYLGILMPLRKICELVGLPVDKVLVAYIFNPFIIVEFLISPHTDSLMIFFVLLSIYFLLQKRGVLSVASYLLSLGVKIVSLPMIIGHVIYFLKPLSKLQTIKVFSLVSFIGAAIIIAKWSINPWYFALPITLCSLLLEIKFYRYLVFSLSAASLVRYLPYFYWGFFDPNNKIRAELFLLMMLPFCLWFLRNVWNVSLRHIK